MKPRLARLVGALARTANPLHIGCAKCDDENACALCYCSRDCGKPRCARRDGVS